VKVRLFTSSTRAIRSCSTRDPASEPRHSTISLRARLAWNASQAYSDSKLYLPALAFAVARHWPDVLSNAVDPGWVPTRMGGPDAPDDLEQGHLTQTWLATSGDPDATVSGRYWHHRRQQTPSNEATNAVFQDQRLAKLSELSGVSLV
jgi:NAD(P)-dependent dehydrogenase (short-subunit alcohol dehydrogenase family)